ncbi:MULTISPECIES: universal stress protein [Saliphagus]|uniref:Universal stress protein n=1 Tax=Saliphagus infecundisoli TaxID=1849069 RepID=A0ABD5QC61_9EURY|nr:MULTISPECIES: universal stress protein [Saliphagus]
MTLVVVPVRYPLTEHSRRTLEEALEVAEEREAALTVLHVNLYQTSKNVTRTDLKRAVERAVGRIENVRYVVRTGFLVEESILDEVAGEEADIVVIGHKQAGRWRRLLRRFTDNPNIDRYLRDHLDCEVITVEGAAA